MLDGRPREPAPTTLMNMHKSKGKEFDGVIIVEGSHGRGSILDLRRSSEDILRQRRVLRVAITRARHRVILIRPADAHPLFTSN